jgi:flagellar biosynthesis protein FliQ
MQSVTQIQEVTLTFVPKLVGVGLVVVLAGHWMLREIIHFTQTLFTELPSLLA